MSAPATPSLATMSATNAGPEVSWPTRRIGGFANIDYGGMDALDDVHFKLGDVVLHATAELSTYWSFFTEVTFNPKQVKVERAILRYDYSEYFTFSAGRYHQRILYWNDTFHHGRWLQTTIERPSIIVFGGKLLPVHSTGVVIEGALPILPALGLQYHLGLTDGNADHTHDSSMPASINSLSEVAFTGSLMARPPSVRGLQLGLTGYYDPAYVHGTMKMPMTTISAHVALERETPEIIAEYLHLRHDHMGSVFTSNAAYLQVAWRLSAFDGLMKPYYRFEWTRLSRDDVALATLQSGDRHTAGLRLDLTSVVALKLEYRNVTPVGMQSSHGGFAQLGMAW